MKAWTDGATWEANPGPMGAGIYYEDGSSLCETLWWGTSNEAEWMALILCVEHFITEMPDKHLEIFSDSQLIVNQAKKRFVVRAKNLEPLAARWFWLQKVARKLKKKVTITWIPREENKRADEISKAAASLTADTVGVGPDEDRGDEGEDTD